MSDYSKLLIYGDFILHFMLIILPYGRNNFKSFYCILLKFILHGANNQLSDKFNNGGWQLSNVLLFQTISLLNDH